MVPLKNNHLNLDVFYKNDDLPRISIGDKVNLTMYLELPKEVEEGEKRAKERIQKFEGVVIAKHLNNSKIDATITVRKMFQESIYQLNLMLLKDSLLQILCL